MTVTAQAVPILSDNYAWLLRDGPTGVTAIVDPADPAPIEAAIDAAGGRLDMILLTHHHDDHIAGTDRIRARYGSRVVGAAADARRLPKLDQAVKEGDRVTLGSAHAEIIDTPGHTVGHIAFYFPSGHVLICGDTLFSLGCGRLLEGTAAQMFASLNKFTLLPADTIVCCGHEYTESNARFALHADPDNQALRGRADQVRKLRAAGQATVPSSMADELAENPFLRAPDLGAFAALRLAKDTF